MDSLAELFSGGHQRSYQKGQIILYQGESTPNTFFIKSGRVKLYDISKGGHEKLLLILKPGDVFPVIWNFLRPVAVHYFFETTEDTTVVTIPRETFNEKVKESHHFSHELLRYFSIRTQQLMARIECIDSTSARHKVALVLRYLAEVHGTETKPGLFTVQMDVTHQTIANMAGITRETTSIELKSLTQKKVCKTKKGKFIVDVNLLNEMVD